MVDLDKKVEEAYNSLVLKHGSTFAKPCAASDCSLMPEELVKTNRSYFEDELSTKTYCEQCGQRLRYHRKMWARRGESVPLTLEEVAARHY